MSSAAGGIRNYQALIRELESTQDKAKTVIQRTIADAKGRGPGWIASGVTERYGIKKKEIPTKAGSAAAGELRTKGDAVKELQLIYTGRMLTLTHFGMTPTAPRPTYTLKASVLKGQKVVLGQKKKLTKKQLQNIGRNFTRQGTRNSPSSPIMLMPTGSTYIPFQRKSQARNDLEAIKAISLPQMVTDGKNGPLRAEAAQKFNDGLEKRFNNHRKLLER